ncbi:MAG TPA: HWE histidine kinase domain-containing protein, partial [Hyphomicrobiaceae bacterium]|nr:HWE histidine kinase domain-containing protein [Hyphomicrobiaceae bacterium]
GYFIILHNPQVSFPTFWLYWLISEAVGVLVIAPLVIGIARSTRNPPRVSELAEGTCILVVLALMSVLAFIGSTGHWYTMLPLAMVLPLLLWPAARCPPVFAAAAIFVLAVVIMMSAILGIGHLGEADISLGQRLLAAQTALVTVSSCTLVMAALFAERRSREALLGSSIARLRTQKDAFRRLLGSLPAAIYTTDTTGRITYCNQAAIDLWGRRPQLGRDKWFDLWRLHYPDGRSVPLHERPTKIVLSEGRAVRGREALLERPDGTLVPIMPCPAPMLDERGKTIGVVNMQVDLTERKQAEAALAERDTFLTLASKAARVGTYTLDLPTKTVRLSPGLAALYGLPEGITELSRADARARVHPEDLQGLDEGMRQAWQERRGEHVAEFRVVRANDGEVCWIELRSLISYDGEQPRRVVGVGIDVTAHKRAEEHQRLLVAELDHRVKNVLATVSAVASRTQDASRSGDDFAAALAGRIRSMAATHELLSGRQWKGVSVHALVRRVLAPYMTPGNTDIDGPDAILRPEAGQAVSMVLHELATNAAKHGALSTDGGRISVSWKPIDGEIRIVWQESGGPPVPPPQRSGYGTEVIRGLIPYELGGSVELAFEPEGVRCVLTIPAAEKKKSQDRNELPPSIEAVGDLI